MKGASELGEILFGCNTQHNKVLDWYHEHENDEIFKTEEGIKLKNHLVGMIKHEALAMLVLGIIELQEALKHPDIFISAETYEAFKEVMNVTDFKKGS